MPAVSFTVDATRLDAHLQAIGPAVEQALLEALKPIASTMAGEARSAAEAHIHLFGKYAGQYLASIYGGVSSKDGQLGKIVGGFVRSGWFTAPWLEHGVEDTGAHDILPKAADVLAFDGDAGKVFARVVHHPGAKIPPYPAIEPTLAAHESEIRDAMTEAVRKAAE
jgi:hypothetical protein